MRWVSSLGAWTLARVIASGTSVCYKLTGQMSNEGSRKSNTLSAFRRPSPPPRRTLVDPNEEAYEALKDAENIRRDARRRESLHSYTGEDEITKNGVHEVHNHVTVNMPHPSPSQPDGKVDVETSIEVGPVRVKGLPKWAVIATAALAAAVTALLAHVLH